MNKSKRPSPSRAPVRKRMWRLFAVAACDDGEILPTDYPQLFLRITGAKRFARGPWEFGGKSISVEVIEVEVRAPARGRKR